MDKLNIKNKIILVCGGSGQVGRSIIKYLLNKLRKFNYLE